MKNSVLAQIFLKDKSKNLGNSVFICGVNFLSALIEGVSFSILLLAFSSLGENPLNTPFALLNQLIDYINQFSQTQAFIIYVTLAIFMQILRSAFSSVGQYFTIKLTTKFQETSQKEIFEHIFKFSFPCINKYKLGNLVEYINIPAKIIYVVMDGINIFVVSSLSAISLIIILFMISTPLTISMLLFTSGTLLLQKIVIKKMTSSSNKLADSQAQFSENLIQSLNGIRAIFTFHQHKNETAKINKEVEEIGVITKRLKYLVFSITPISELSGIIVVGFCMLCGTFFLRDTSLALLPILLSYVSISYRLSTTLQKASAAMSVFFQNIGSLSRIKQILSSEDKEYAKDGGKPLQCFSNSIQFNHLTLKYPSTKSHALQNLSFTLPKGTTTALVGTSGAGKSSIIDLLLRLYDPSAGSILIDGKNISEYDLKSWRGLFGVVSQDTFTFNDSIVENICFGHKASLSEVIQAAKTAEAHQFIMNLHDNYQTIIGERGHKLSGGERQRLALARALVRDPKILILDEATSNLDSYSESLIQEALEKYQTHKTLIIITHRLSTIINADQILVIEKGQLLEQGTHHELLKQKGQYAKLWQLQSRDRAEESLSLLS